MVSFRVCSPPTLNSNDESIHHENDAGTLDNIYVSLTMTWRLRKPVNHHYAYLIWPILVCLENAWLHINILAKFSTNDFSRNEYVLMVMLMVIVRNDKCTSLMSKKPLRLVVCFSYLYHI